MRHDPDGFPRWRSDLDTAADTHGLGRWRRGLFAIAAVSRFLI